MTRVEADRDLLFGILALQNGLVEQADLIAAFQAWSKDRSRPLAQVLVDRGAITEADRALLAELVRRHVERHGGDPGRSLAAAADALPASAADGLRRLGEPAIDATLARRSSANGSVRQTADGPPTAPDDQSTIAWGLGAATSAGGRFRVLRPHARGGLGLVSVALDAELHREVALKEIQPEQADDPSSRARFLLEAELTGRLEHPGVVPVYGLGAGPQGRPYYAMRFVRGESLREAIDRFHRADADPARDPGERLLALRGLLARFLDVCNAVAYAHDRGVIHRDIKPANILLGPYGETLLVDWGLAKVIGRDQPDPAAEATLRPSGGSGSSETVAGTAVGTPAYMSPEQAEGKLEAIGPASDLYSLGATLYCLLTGRPPLEGPDIPEILRRAQRGDFPPPRQVNRRVPAAMEAITLKAMAPRPADRYASARALAEDIEHWLADEPVSAHREPLPARLGRWARRHRPLVAGAAGLLIAATVGLSIGAILLNRANTQIRLKKEEADENFAMAREAVDRYFTRVSENRLLNEPHMERLRKELLATAREFYQKFVARRQGDSQAQADLGRAYLRLSDIDSALGAKREAIALGKLSRSLFTKLASRDPAIASYRRDLAFSHKKLGNFYRDTGRVEEAESSYRRSLEIRQQLVDEHPEIAEYRGDLAGSLIGLGVIYAETGRASEAESAYKMAQETITKLADEYPEDSQYQVDLAGIYNNLASLLHDTGRLPEAESAFRRALSIRQRLADDHPSVAEYRSQLAGTYNDLGNLYRSQGRALEAESMYRQAIESHRRLADEHSDITQYRNALAGSQICLGILYAESGRPGDAESSFRRALEIQEKLANEHPESILHRSQLAIGFNNLGELLMSTGHVSGAEPAFKRALEIQEDLAKGNPEQLDLLSSLGAMYGNLGNIAKDSDEPGKACNWYTRSIAVLEDILRREPRHITSLQFLRNARAGRAETLTRLGRPAEAVSDWDRAIELDDGRMRDQYRLLRAIALARSGDHRRSAAEAESLAEAASPDPGVQAYNLACVLAQAASAALRDDALDQAERSEQADRLAAGAVQRLRQAEGIGFFRDRAQFPNMDADPDLDPLRRRDGFRAWRSAALDRGFPAVPFAR